MNDPQIRRVVSKGQQESPQSEAGLLRHVRSIFISDVHLGCGFSQASRLLEYLGRYRCDHIYIVGDLIDGWELKKRWHWNEELSRLIQFLLERAQEGTSVRYVTGNHDDFLRTHRFLPEVFRCANVQVADNFTHVTADHRRFLVTHGDSFDDYENKSKAFNWLATLMYSSLLRMNRVCNHRWGWRPAVVSIRAKSLLTSMTYHLREFRKLLTKHAASQGYDGVICGHIHEPERSTLHGVEYCNTGDWVESCSAIIEETNGRLSLEFCDADPM